jgi:hypothetical protein
MVCERANRVLSDRARNEDRTPARGIHKCHFYSARATGRKEADCAGNKDRLDVKRSRALVADAGLNPGSNSIAAHNHIFQTAGFLPRYEVARHEILLGP